MTENEAIKACNTIVYAALSGIQRAPLNMTKNELAEAIGMAVKALEEVRVLQDRFVDVSIRLGEYMAIGTPEECREAMKKKSEKPMAELGVFGNPEEKDIGRLEALHHKILYSKLAEIVTEQEMIAFLRAKDAVRKQIRKPVKNPYGTSYIWKAGYCPVCGCGVTARWDYCQCCGQKLNWQV